MRFITWLSEKKSKGSIKKTISLGITKKHWGEVHAIVSLSETQDGYVLEINDALLRKYGITLRHRHI